MRRIVHLKINDEAWVEVCNIGSGAFYPLKGFMDSADYRSVVDSLRLVNGSPWTIPVTLDIPADRMNTFIKANKAILINNLEEKVAELFIKDIYKVNLKRDIKKIFGTDDKAHPGVAKEISRSPYRLGGDIDVLHYERRVFPEYSLSPAETKQRFSQKGWKTIVGFQTRNPIHRAHEYLQRTAMEIADGVLIQPLIGWKKDGDFSSLAVMRSYEIMIKQFYHEKRAMLCALKTPMRYAGPREAIFHAIIRRNFGCTHFIVGRDHAGVGKYYGEYDAHLLCDRFNNDLGIEILKLYGPYYCKKCGHVVSEKTCSHDKKYAITISGTGLRSLFLSGKRPSKEYMRKEIVDELMVLKKNKQLFCGGKHNEI